MKKEIEINSRFGNLLVLKYIGSKNYNNIYLCKCDCGKEVEKRVTDLLSLGITHCGCKNFVSKPHGNRKYDPIEAGFRAKASNYKSLAKLREVEFDLTQDETVELLKGDCFYCGKKPSNKYNVRENNRINKKNNIQYSFNNKDGFDILYNGIDRKNNELGYTKDNCVSCCTQCNTAKLNFSESNFKEWIKNIYNKYILGNK